MDSIIPAGCIVYAGMLLTLDEARQYIPAGEYQVVGRRSDSVSQRRYTLVVTGLGAVLMDPKPQPATMAKA